MPQWARAGLGLVDAPTLAAERDGHGHETDDPVVAPSGRKLYGVAHRFLPASQRRPLRPRRLSASSSSVLASPYTPEEEPLMADQTPEKPTGRTPEGISCPGQKSGVGFPQRHNAQAA